MPDPEGLAAKMVSLRYIDDRAYAEAKAASLARRGMGARRVRQALHAARIGAEDSEAVAPQVAEAAESSSRVDKGGSRVDKGGPEAPRTRRLAANDCRRLVRIRRSLTATRRLVARVRTVRDQASWPQGGCRSRLIPRV